MDEERAGCAVQALHRGARIGHSLSFGMRMTDKNDILPELLKLIEGLSEKEQRELYRELLRRPVRRKHPRRPFDYEVKFAVDGEEYTGQIRNISFGGIFIETENRFPVGKVVRLRIPMTRSTRTLSTLGVIVRTDMAGIGVKLIKGKKGADRKTPATSTDPTPPPPRVEAGDSEEPS